MSAELLRKTVLHVLIFLIVIVTMSAVAIWLGLGTVVE